MSRYSMSKTYKVKNYYPLIIDKENESYDTVPGEDIVILKVYDNDANNAFYKVENLNTCILDWFLVSEKDLDYIIGA